MLAAGRDPDKPDAACVYLWARNPALCNGAQAAGPGFNTSRTQGQLRLPGGVMCRVGRQTISTRVFLMMPTARVSPRPYVDVTAAMSDQPRDRAIALTPVDSGDPFAEVEL